jgi:phosphatidylglycerophosphatase B
MKDKAKGFIRSFLALSMLLAVLASLNEFVLKPTLRVARPSHAFILRQSHSDVTLDSVYRLAEVKRKDFFRRLVATDTTEFRKIDPRVLDHWVDEAGYSFPSGHTFNAFLIGPLLAFSLLSSRSRAIRFICFLPLLWALFVGVSRVSLGAHSALDVSVGAGMGLFLAHLLLFFPSIRRLLIPVSTLDNRR